MFLFFEATWFPFQIEQTDSKNVTIEYTTAQWQTHQFKFGSQECRVHTKKKTNSNNNKNYLLHKDCDRFPMIAMKNKPFATETNRERKKDVDTTNLWLTHYIIAWLVNFYGIFCFFLKVWTCSGPKMKFYDLSWWNKKK